jgi:hypothetical protein
MNQKERALAFIHQCDIARLVFADRNAKYGDAIVETGVLGACVELVGGVARLKELVIKAPDHGASVDDYVLRNVLIDIHNYANIALMMMDADNWSGGDTPNE